MAGEPVIFLEYDADSVPYTRYSRWWAAYDGTSATLPLVMVDSGNQILSGYVSFYSAYQAMVVSSMARPPQAEIKATWQRVGNKVDFSVQVKNLSGVTLNSMTNNATVHAIVYEDKHVKSTDRFVRGVDAEGITTLAPNATGTYAMATGDLVDVDWDKLHYLVLVDYRPGGNTGSYDMLQAAIAQELIPFSVSPDPLTFVVDPAEPFGSSVLVRVRGPLGMTWQASALPAWLTMTPSSGTTTDQPVLSAITANLTPGWQQTTIVFTSDDGLNSDAVQVQAYYGPAKRLFLPTTLR